MNMLLHSLLQRLKGLILGIFVFSMALQPVLAQTGITRCYTMEMDSIQRAEHQLPSLKQVDDWINQKVIEYKARNAHQRAAVVTLPVVFHIIHDGEPIGSGNNISLEQIQSQIEILNEDFRRTNPDRTNTLSAFTPVAADTEIEFCLGGITRTHWDDPNWTASSYTSCYINDEIKPVTIWDPEKYINYWVVGPITRCNGTGSLLGYSTWPEGGHGLSGVGTNGGTIVDEDGVVCIPSSVGRAPANTNGGRYNAGRTGTHELGHFFGLRHVWGDGDCSATDHCDDTPDSDDPNYGCPLTHESCETLDMVQNYMDYTDDACMNLFTEDQKTRMRAVLNNSPRRNSLISAGTCCPTIAGTITPTTYNGAELSCTGSANGRLTVSGSGGLAPYSYLWDNGATTATISNLSAGTYSVTVSDANGCPGIVSYTIVPPEPVVATAAGTSNYTGYNISCTGGSDGIAEVSATGGVGGYTYQWDANTGGQTTKVATGLAAASYAVTVTDANGCSKSATVSLSEPPAIAVSALAASDYNGFNVSCFGGSDGMAEANPSGGVGGYTYQWDANTGSQTTKVATGLAAASYAVTATDANGCSKSATVSLSEPPAVTVSAFATSDYNGFNVSCFGGSDGMAEANPSGGVGGYTYQWDANTGSQTTKVATGLAAGFYSVTVTDANGCAEATSVTLTAPTLLVLDAGSNQTVYFGYPDSACANLEVGLTSGGVPPYNYSWSTGEAGPSIHVCPEVTTVYTLTVTDANGCEMTDEVKVCVINVLCGGNGNNPKIEISHYTGNSTCQTLCVSSNAAPAHFLHGDRIGGCDIVRSCEETTAKTNFGIDDIEMEVYPNPFEAYTTIRFRAKKDDVAIIRMIDISGREVLKVFNNSVLAGESYQLNIPGERLTAGIYFCILQFGDGSFHTAKMVYTPR